MFQIFLGFIAAEFCPGKLRKEIQWLCSIRMAMPHPYGKDRPDNIESAIAWLDYCTFFIYQSRLSKIFILCCR